MHHEIHIVEQHPPSLRQPFHMMGLVPGGRASAVMRWSAIPRTCAFDVPDTMTK